MKRRLIKWLGIDCNSSRIESLEKKLNYLVDSNMETNGLVKGNNTRITRIENKIKKH